MFGLCFLCSHAAPRAPKLVCCAPNEKSPGDLARVSECSGSAFQLLSPRWFLPSAGLRTQSMRLHSLPDGFAFNFLFVWFPLGPGWGAWSWAQPFASRLLF